MTESTLKPDSRSAATRWVRICFGLVAVFAFLVGVSWTFIQLSRLQSPPTSEELNELRLEAPEEYRAAMQRLEHSVVGPLRPNMKVIEPFRHEMNPLVTAELLIVGEALQNAKSGAWEMHYAIKPGRLLVRWGRLAGLTGILLAVALAASALLFPEQLHLASSSSAQVQRLEIPSGSEKPEDLLAAEVRGLITYCRGLDRRANRLLVTGLSLALVGAGVFYFLVPDKLFGVSPVSTHRDWSFLPSLTLVAYMQAVALAVLGLYRKSVADVSHYQAQRHRLLGLIAAMKLAESPAEGFEERLASLARTLNAGSVQRAAQGAEVGGLNSALSSVMKGLQKRPPE
jgi:hypothetical protein